MAINSLDVQHCYLTNSFYVPLNFSRCNFASIHDINKYASSRLAFGKRHSFTGRCGKMCYVLYLVEIRQATRPRLALAVRHVNKCVFITLLQWLKGPAESCWGFTFITLWRAVTWHAIYGHNDKGIDVKDVRNLESVTPVFTPV